MKNKKSDRPDISPEKYNHLLKGVELQSVILKSAKLDMREKDLHVDKIIVQIEADHQYFIEDPHQPVVDCSMKFTGKIHNKKVIEIFCCFETTFSSQEEATDDFMQLFSNIAVPLIAHPYAREFIQNSLARMNMPPFLLPLTKREPD